MVYNCIKDCYPLTGLRLAFIKGKFYIPHNNRLTTEYGEELEICEELKTFFYITHNLTT